MRGAVRQAIRLSRLAEEVARSASEGERSDGCAARTDVLSPSLLPQAGEGIAVIRLGGAIRLRRDRSGAVPTSALRQPAETRAETQDRPSARRPIPPSAPGA